ncbi:MAG: DsrE family protein [Thiomonas delicata]|jgi:intracellular sulfur oxidation DsrE/DsrF family protein|uniref:DsrE family protein n=1 Tax=Thiomonas sp. TaxID=2047785 RepID=UPI00258EC4D8|nr:DsrE family protein [Thiomonas sp.]
MHIHRWARAVRHFLALATFVWGGLGLAHAANPSMLNDFKFDQPTFIHKLPFAEHKLVLQVSVGEPEYWNLILNNAQNVLDAFGQEKVRIVIVAYGPGLKMLLKDSPVAARIASQNDEGVEFDACHNTMLGMAKKLGHMPELVPSAVIVPGGVVRIMQLEKAGFAYIRP